MVRSSCAYLMLMLCLCRSANAIEISISISVRWSRWFKNLRNRYSRDKKKVQNVKVSGTDTQSVKDAKSETSDMYMFLAWLDPYAQPRRSSSNLIVIDEISQVDDGDNDDEGTCTPASVDSSSSRSITPDPSFESKSFKSKVTGRPKYLHAKRPRVNNEAIEGTEIDFLKSIGNHLVSRDI